MDIAASGNVESAWANLLYVNNFITVSEQYMPWCWSLAIEEQFYLLAPFFLLLVVGRTSRPFSIMLVLLLVSGLIRLAVIRAHDFVPPYNDPPDTAIWSLRFDRIYDKLHVRYGGLLAGAIGAFISLFHKEKVEKFFGKSTRSNLIAALSLIIFAMIATMSFGLLVFFGPQTPRSDHPLTSQRFILCCRATNHHGCDTWNWRFGQSNERIAFRKGPLPNRSIILFCLPASQMLMLWMFPKTTPWLVDTLGLGPNSVLFVNGLTITVATFAGAAFLYVAVERPFMEFRRSKVFKRVFAPSELKVAESVA